MPKYIFNVAQKNRKGSGTLIIAIMLCVITSVISLSSVQLSNGIFTSLSASRTALQATQYAESKAETVRATNYINLAAQAKIAISGTKFSDEVILGAETTNGSTKNRTMQVKVYTGTETTPRITLDVPRSTMETVSGVPIGSIIAWASWTLPKDGGTWLICNGQSTAAYPALAAIIGSNVPNYQGVFLRGYGQHQSFHYTNISHASADLGILQGDSVREIYGTFGELTSEYGNFSTSGVFTRIGNSGGRAAAGSDSYGTWVDFYASRVTPVSNEIRPINKAVFWLIKAA